MASLPPLQIVLTGPMGSGKTTVGRRLAERTGRPFLDSDVQLGDTFGRTGQALARRHGVAWLHRAEAKALREALAVAQPAVIAAAASVGDLADISHLLKGEDVMTVLLTGDPATLARRSTRGDHRRLVDEESYREISQRRHVVLAEVADLVVDVTSTPPAAVADQVLSALESRSAAAEEERRDRGAHHAQRHW